MKCHFIVILLLAVFGNTLLCSFKTDSLALEKAVKEYYMTRPDSILDLLDDAEHHKVMASARIDILRAMVYGNMSMPVLEESCLRRVLSVPKTTSNPNLHLKALSMMVDALQEQGKYSECIPMAMQGMNLAKKLNNRVVEYSLLSTLAMASFRLEQYQDGYEYLQQIIKGGSKSDDVRVLSHVSYAYGMLINQLVSDTRYEEALKAVYARRDLLERMKDMPGPPSGYIDQQKAYLYSKMANLYLSMGKTAQAEEAYRAFMQTEEAKRVESGYTILPYLQKAGRHKDVLDRIRELHTLWQGCDTVNMQYRLLLEYEAKSEGALGNYQRMAELNRCALVLTDSIYMRKLNSRAQEFATIFKVNEKEKQLQEEQGKSERSSLMLIGSVVVLVLLATLVIVVCLNLRRMKRRNRIAARQIEELLAQREEFRRCLTCNDMQKDVPPMEKKAGQEEKTSGTSNQSYETFLRMEQLIMEQQLFLQPRFGRDELLRTTGIHKNDLSSLLKRYAGVPNLNSYLNRLRVEYSVKLIKEKRNFSIEAIAEEAGFNSRSTFYRAFYKQYGMTPTEYIDTL